MNKMLKYMMWAVVVAVVFTAVGAVASSGGVVASTTGGGSSGNVFSTVLARMAVTFRNSRSVIFIVGGFGLIGLGFAAIFGKVNWKWLAALACGLAIVAVAGQVVDYVTRSDVGQRVKDSHGTDMNDTLTSGSGDGYTGDDRSI